MLGDGDRIAGPWSERTEDEFYASWKLSKVGDSATTPGASSPRRRAAHPIDRRGANLCLLKVFGVDSYFLELNAFIHQ